MKRTWLPRQQRKRQKQIRGERLVQLSRYLQIIGGLFSFFSFFFNRVRGRRKRTGPDGEERSVSGGQTGTSTGSEEEGRKEGAASSLWLQVENEDK